MIFLEIDPNVVKPGWIPLLITIALAIVMVFLFISMRHQMRKISAPYADESKLGQSPESPNGSDPR